jgi:hypothetical protein
MPLENVLKKLPTGSFRPQMYKSMNRISCVCSCNKGARFELSRGPRMNTAMGQTRPGPAGHSPAAPFTPSIIRSIAIPFWFVFRSLSHHSDLCDFIVFEGDLLAIRFLCRSCATAATCGNHLNFFRGDVITPTDSLSIQ